MSPEEIKIEPVDLNLVNFNSETLSYVDEKGNLVKLPRILISVIREIHGIILSVASLGADEVIRQIEEKIAVLRGRIREDILRNIAYGGPRLVKLHHIDTVGNANIRSDEALVRHLKSINGKLHTYLLAPAFNGGSLTFMTADERFVLPESNNTFYIGEDPGKKSVGWGITSFQDFEDFISKQIGQKNENALVEGLQSVTEGLTKNAVVTERFSGQEMSELSLANVCTREQMIAVLEEDTQCTSLFKRIKLLEQNDVTTVVGDFATWRFQMENVIN